MDSQSCCCSHMIGKKCFIYALPYPSMTFDGKVETRKNTRNLLVTACRGLTAVELYQELPTCADALLAGSELVGVRHLTLVLANNAFSPRQTLLWQLARYSVPRGRVPDITYIPRCSKHQWIGIVFWSPELMI